MEEERGGLVVLDPSRVQERPKTGRQRPAVKYSRELAQEIADAVSMSSYGLDRLCAMNQHWPRKLSIIHWRQRHEEFRQMMAEADKARAEMLIGELIEIADDTSNDFIEIDGRMVPNPAAPGLKKVRCDVRKWVIAKLHPQKYGDKLDLSTAFGAVSQEDAIRQLR